MPKKNTAGIFHRLARLRARARHFKIEIARITAAVAERNGTASASDLKLQLRQARDTVVELEQFLTPMAHHVDVPFSSAPAGGIAHG
jgi:hypothetical protein